MSGQLPIHQIGTVLGVWAHPDDEAYLSAGLMTLARRAGQRVVVVTATAGEHGTDDPTRWPPARLARRRRREMANSLRSLGVREHHWLGYPDGGCDEVADASAIDAIGRIVDAVRPDTIVTFGPDGMTGHPDHCAVSAWTTAAWQRHRPAARLWYATTLPSFHDEWRDINAQIGIFPEGSRPPITAEADAAVVRCEGWVLERKAAALQAHASQIQPLVALMGETRYRQWWSVESFVAAAPILTGASR
jgi:LmbE family N-acetylglucosaminyl deacetylase